MKRHRGPDRDRPAHRLSRPGPSDPGAAAARARVEAVLERSTRIGLQVVVVPPPDATRLAARERARTAAIVAGRTALLDEAVAAARATTVRAFARGGFSGTWAATDMAVSAVRAGDRVAAGAALEEATIAAVTEDLVDDDTLEVLRSTWDDLGRLGSIPSPGSLSSIGSGGLALRGPLQIGLVAAFAIFLAAIGLGVGSLVALALGLTMIAGLARRRTQPDP